MKAYKGFNADMTCRGFQFTEGETYEHDGPVEVCKSGFHTVMMPLDALAYYAPAGSVYHEVEVDDYAATHGADSKVASRRIKIGARVNIAGLVKAQIAAVFDRSTVEPGSSATGWRGAASATGYSGAASATGDHSVALAAGYRSRAIGAKGCALCLIERGTDGKILAAKAVIVGRKSGGRTIRPGVWYGLIGGCVVEVDDDGEAQS